MARLYECQSKNLLKERGVNVPEGDVADSVSDIPKAEP